VNVREIFDTQMRQHKRVLHLRADTPVRSRLQASLQRQLLGHRRVLGKPAQLSARLASVLREQGGQFRVFDQVAIVLVRLSVFPEHSAMRRYRRVLDRPVQVRRANVREMRQPTGDVQVRKF